MKRSVFLALSLLIAALPMRAGAADALPAYTIDAAKSELSFTALQNNAPVTGTFRDFSGEIRFDPARAGEGAVEVRVALDSLQSAYPEMKTELLGPAWFNAGEHPQAVFKTTSITPMPARGPQPVDFAGEGTLELRGVKTPVTVNFRVEEFTPKRAVATGHLTLSRTRLGVGQGEWADTKTVKDPVTVKFRVTAVR